MRTPQEIKKEMHDLTEADFLDWKRYEELEKELEELKDDYAQIRNLKIKLETLKSCLPIEEENEKLKKEADENLPKWLQKGYSSGFEDAEMKYNKEKAELIEKIKSKEVLEALSDLEHQQWAEWTDYYFKTQITQEKMDRWQNQMNTPYWKLSEKEKESDRKFARLVIEKILDTFKNQDTTKLNNRSIFKSDEGLGQGDAVNHVQQNEDTSAPVSNSKSSLTAKNSLTAKEVEE